MPGALAQQAGVGGICEQVSFKELVFGAPFGQHCHVFHTCLLWDNIVWVGSRYAQW